METYETIIIGAGPAGLICAATLAQQGHTVLILERNNIIGHKVCAGGIPYHGLQHLGLPPHLIEQSFPAQFVITPWQQAKIIAPEPIINTVSRHKLGQFMAHQARQAGAAIRTGARITRINRNTVETKETRYSCKNLVGADGSSSLVRRFLGIPTTGMGVGIHYQVPGPFSQMEWHIEPRVFGSGYAWIFPHNGHASIGAYADRQEIPPILLQKRLHEWAARQGISFRGCSPEAALINFDYQGWRFGNVYLTGDAAGLASALTGEGVLPAVISGMAAAKAIMAPHHDDQQLATLIAKHQRHRQMQKLFTGNKVICHLLLEVLVLALRSGMLPFSSLEMGSR